MYINYSDRKYLKNSAANAVRMSEFNKGDIIFKKGEMGATMYEIRSGSVGIYLDYKGPNQKLLTVKQSGEFFGEIALIEDRPRTATAVAMEEMTKLREISINGFPNYVKSRTDILKPIMDAMSDRFKMQRRMYFEVCETLKAYVEAVENDLEPSDEVLEKTKQFIKDLEKDNYKGDI